MLCVVYKCSMFVYMNKLACIFSSPSYSLIVLVINFCIVEPHNFTLYTKRTYMHSENSFRERVPSYVDAVPVHAHRTGDTRFPV